MAFSIFSTNDDYTDITKIVKWWQNGQDDKYTWVLGTFSPSGQWKSKNIPRNSLVSVSGICQILPRISVCPDGNIGQCGPVIALYISSEMLYRVYCSPGRAKYGVFCDIKKSSCAFAIDALYSYPDHVVFNRFISETNYWVKLIQIEIPCKCWKIWIYHYAFPRYFFQMTVMISNDTLWREGCAISQSASQSCISSLAHAVQCWQPTGIHCPMYTVPGRLLMPL